MCADLVAAEAAGRSVVVMELCERLTFRQSKILFGSNSEDQYKVRGGRCDLPFNPISVRSAIHEISVDIVKYFLAEI